MGGIRRRRARHNPIAFRHEIEDFPTPVEKRGQQRLEYCPHSLQANTDATIADIQRLIGQSVFYAEALLRLKHLANEGIVLFDAH